MASGNQLRPLGPRPPHRSAVVAPSGFRHRGRPVEDVDIIWDLELYSGRDSEPAFGAWYRSVSLKPGFLPFSQLTVLVFTCCSQVTASVNQTPESLRLSKRSSLISLLMASGYKFNHRNLEDRWYGFWLPEIQRLVDSIDPGRFSIIPQFNLWRHNKAHEGYVEKELLPHDASSSQVFPLEVKAWLRNLDKTGRDVLDWADTENSTYWANAASVQETSEDAEVMG